MRPSREEFRRPQRWIAIPAGRAALGIAASDAPFSWDNERPRFEVDVPSFAIERHDTTNASYLEFVEAGGYRDPRWWRQDDWAWVQREGVRHPAFWARRGGDWHWRGMFEMLPLPKSWPVYVSFAEANAYRALARRAASFGSGVPARRLRIGFGRRPALSLGQ